MSTANPNTPDAMTVRDQFAMAAMSGLLAHHGQQFKHGGEMSLAQQAYRIADAMIVERTVSPALIIHETPTPDRGSHLEPIGATCCYEPAKNSFGGNSYTDRAGVAYGDGEDGSESDGWSRAIAAGRHFARCWNRNRRTRNKDESRPWRTRPTPSLCGPPRSNCPPRVLFEMSACRCPARRCWCTDGDGVRITVEHG